MIQDFSLPQYQSRWGARGQLFCCHKRTVQITHCFVLGRTRGKSMFSNEASSLRFDLNSGETVPVAC